MTDTRLPEVRKPDPLEPLLRRYLETADQEAIEELHRLTRPRLLAAARRIGAPQDAEDAVQSAYLALVARGAAVLAAPIQAWLLTAVVRIAYRRKAVDQRQHDVARSLAIPRDGVAYADEGLASDDAALVRRHVQSLPPTYRDPVVLHYLEGLDTDETSDLLGVTPGALRVRLHRARKLLRTGLAGPFLAVLFAAPWWGADVVRRLLGRPGYAMPGAAVATSLWGTMMLAVVLAAGGTLIATGVVSAPWAESWLGVGGDEGSSAATHGAGATDRDADLADARPSRRARRKRGGGGMDEAVDAPSAPRLGAPGETEVQELYYVSGPLRARHEMLWRDGGAVVKHGPCETFYVNGEKEAVGAYDSDLRQGPWTEWFESGAKLSEGAYRSGEMHGAWTFYFEATNENPAGAKHEVGAYVAGKRAGAWTIRFRNGNVQYEGAYANGLKDGEWVEHFESGAVMQKGPYDAGDRTGAWKAWNDDGTLAWEATFLEDELHGEHVEIDRSGMRTVTGYVRGVVHGTRATFYPTGEKWSLAEFRDGKLHGRSVTWYRGGHKQAEFHYERGTTHGAAAMWYADGTPSGKWAYERGKSVGTSTTWFPNGRKRIEFVHGENMRVTSTSWYRDGGVRESGALVAGTRTRTWQFRLKDGTRYECTYGRFGRVTVGTLIWFRPSSVHESATGIQSWELIPHGLRTYRDGKYHGPAIDFHPGGVSKRAEWNNVDGVAEGVVTYWDTEGNETKKELWKGGEIVPDPDASEE